LFNTNFTPYLNLGLGPTFILTTPYDKEFFTSFGYARMYVRLGFFVGTGVNIPVTEESYIGISARQFWIPFGGKGLESVKDKPITDFGGFFLGFNFGIRI
jgi:outer membrane protein W